MLGTVDIKLRPLRFAFLVDPGNAQQAREAIRLASTLWGGAYCPIITKHKRMPKTWRDPIKVPPAKSVVLGNLDAFDPDVLVQLSAQLPAYLTDTKRRIIAPQDVWRTLDDRVAWSPQWSIGVFELFDAMFKEFFKYKDKYPPRMLLPKLPAKMRLFWASVFGDLPPKIADLVRRGHAEPLEIQETEFKVEALGEFMRGDALFPRRWTQYGLNVLGGRRIRGDAAVYFMDGESLEDIIDFGNLRATGRPVLPLPKQFSTTPEFERLITDYLKEHRVHWRHDPKVCEMAHFIRSRHSTMDEMQVYARTLKLDIPKGDTSTDGFFALQHWYPRIWDEWARDKDDAVPRDTYAEPEASIDVEDPKELSVRFKPLLPTFADKDGIHSEGRCANDIEFRFYGAGEYLAEVFPSSSGPHFERACAATIKSAARVDSRRLLPRGGALPHEVCYQCGRPKEDTWQAKSAMRPARICCRRFGSAIEPGPRTRKFKSWMNSLRSRATTATKDTCKERSSDSDDLFVCPPPPETTARLAIARTSPLHAREGCTVGPSITARFPLKLDLKRPVPFLFPYPWRLEPSRSTFRQKRGTKALYDSFRTGFAHDLGLLLETGPIDRRGRVRPKFRIAK